MECSVAHWVRAANAPTPRHFLGWAIAPIHTFIVLLRDCVLGFTAHGRCFVGRNRSLLDVIAALSMTKSIAAHSLLVDISPYWLLRCKVNAPS